jgi:hypothetical protein
MLRAGKCRSRHDDRISSSAGYHDLPATPTHGGDAAAGHGRKSCAIGGNRQLIGRQEQASSIDERDDDGRGGLHCCCLFGY